MRRYRRIHRSQEAVYHPPRLEVFKQQRMEGANFLGFWPVGKAGAVTIPREPKGSSRLGPHESRGVGSPRSK
jgi:hypothetical protein